MVGAAVGARGIGGGGGTAAAAAAAATAGVSPVGGTGVGTVFVAGTGVSGEPTCRALGLDALEGGRGGRSLGFT